MKPKPKRRKMAVCTMYAIRLPDGTWYGDLCSARTSFARAVVFPIRGDAVEEKEYHCPEGKIVPVRVRELPSAKRNKRRNG